MKKKYITVEVEAHIDYDEIDTEDLIFVLGDRTLSSSEKSDILGAIGIDLPVVNNLVDQEKIDLFTKNFDRISLSQLEGFFREL